MIRVEVGVRGHEVSSVHSPTLTHALRDLREALFQALRTGADLPDPEAVRSVVAELDAILEAREAVGELSRFQEVHGSGDPLVWWLEEFSDNPKVAEIEDALQEATRAHRVADRGSS